LLAFFKMAKSLRSKWKRKMKAVKRVRYGEKERKMLDKIVANAEERKRLLAEEHKPQALGADGEEPVAAKDGGEDTMEVESKKSKVNARTLKDDHGTYPVWVSKRKISKIKSKGKNKTTKHVEGKVVKKKGVVRKRF